jgi:signal transduction histidine kinase
MSKFDILKELTSHQNDAEKLATLRHEMLVPIAIIRGYSKLLEKQIGSEENVEPKVVEYVEKIIEASDELRTYPKIAKSHKI